MMIDGGPLNAEFVKSALIPIFDPVGGFVNTYHIWGLFGLITCWIFTRAAYRHWRAQEGRWSHSPIEIGTVIGRIVYGTFLDWGRLPVWLFRRFILRQDYKWPRLYVGEWKYDSDQTLLIGIALGGLSRLLTAMYWAERNRSWMESTDVLWPWVFVMIAIMADINHQITAWAARSHWVRLTVSAAMAYIALGLFFGVSVPLGILSDIFTFIGG